MNQMQAGKSRITRSPSGLLVVTQEQDTRPEEAHDPGTGQASDTRSRRRRAPELTAMAKQDKLIRVATMIRRLCAELREMKLDRDAREGLARTYDRIAEELEDTLPPELRRELEELRPNLGDSPSQAELRVVHAQLLGWLEGLFQGVHVTLTLQRADFARQLRAVRTADPNAFPRPGHHPPSGAPTGGPAYVSNAYL